jgi:hypothetical protein
MLNDPVFDFLMSGPLPSERASPSAIKYRQGQLERIPTPISLGDAHLLVKMFGPDECFGLSGKLIHLIETAPVWASKLRIPEGETPGLQDLRYRAEMARGTQG